MIGTLVGSGIALSIIYGSAKWKDDDLKKMQHVFRNIGYRVKNYEPRLIKKTKYDNKTEYVFSVPYGLIDDEKLQPILQKTLIKPVSVMFRGKLIVRVYNTNLPTKINYEWQQLSDWTIPIGKTLDGMINHNFDEIPHMVVAGATRWGKTVFMKMMMTHLIESHPNDVEFYILDLKGGLAFHRYSNLKQVKAVADDYKSSAETLKMIEKDIKKTMVLMKGNYQENITDSNITTRKFIIIDEAGELMPNKSMTDSDKKHAVTCQRIMSHIARVAGGLGYRMIFGTQYPTADILDNQIKANSSAKITFKLQTGVQSKVAIDEVGAEELEYPGRAIYRTTDKHIVQTPYISNKVMWERLRRFEVDKNETEDKQTGENIIKFG